jgi:hypothetical protein
VKVESLNGCVSAVGHRRPFDQLSLVGFELEEEDVSRRRSMAKTLGILAALLIAAPALATGDYVGPGGDYSLFDGGYNGLLESMFTSALEVPAGEPGGDIIDDIWLEIDNSHTWVGDLVIKLEGPGGDLLTLVSRPGFDEPADDGSGCCGSSSDWILGNVQSFMDGAALHAELMGDAGTPIPPQTLQPTGIYDGSGTPTTSLVGTFGGTNAVGLWRLHIGDSAVGDYGNLGSWTLHLDTIPEPAGLLLIGLGALVLRRR